MGLGIEAKGHIVEIRIVGEATSNHGTAVVAGVTNGPQAPGSHRDGVGSPSGGDMPSGSSEGRVMTRPIADTRRDTIAYALISQGCELLAEIQRDDSYAMLEAAAAEGALDNDDAIVGALDDRDEEQDALDEEMDDQPHQYPEEIEADRVHEDERKRDEMTREDGIYR